MEQFSMLIYGKSTARMNNVEDFFKVTQEPENVMLKDNLVKAFYWALAIGENSSRQLAEKKFLVMWLNYGENINV